MVDKKLSEFDEVSNGDVSFFPVLDNNTKNGKLAATKAMPWTNCITEIPQDINLTLSSGTLTLKAGSKAYMPNGSGVFDIITNSNDLTYTLTANGEHLICVAYNAGGITSRPISSCTSGAGATAVSGFAYNTTTNKINNYSASGTIGGQYTFPIAVITVSDGAISSIDQVFNGFGYIGSSVFALPGIKGLIPNGRNADGTLKNSTFTTSSVLTVTVGSGSTTDILRLTSAALQRGGINYNEEFNYNYVSTYSPSNIRSVAIIGSVSYVSGKITSITTKMAFRAVDYSDFKEMISNIDQNTMKLTGDQEVDGVKTFLQNPYFTPQSSTGGRYICKSNVVDLTDTTRANDLGIGYRTLDKNNNIAGEFSTSFSTTGTSTGTMQVRNRASGSQVTAQIQVIIDKNGNISTNCPTPTSVTDNSTKIATTQWLNNKVKQVSTLPANPTAGVYYFVTE